MYCVWRVSEVRKPFKTMNEAIQEAAQAVSGKEYDEVLILKVIKKVRKIRPKIEVINVKD